MVLGIKTKIIAAQSFMIVLTCLSFVSWSYRKAQS